MGWLVPGTGRDRVCERSTQEVGEGREGSRRRRQQVWSLQLGDRRTYWTLRGLVSCFSQRRKGAALSLSSPSVSLPRQRPHLLTFGPFALETRSGRAWNMTSEGEDSWSDSDDDLALRYRLPTYTSPQRALARRHDEVDDSEHSDDTDESLDSRDQEGEEEEDYESDGFLVRSPPSARGREGVRVMDADTSDGTSSLSSSGESSSSGSSDSESGVVAAAAKRRRARRQEGEVIDLDSDTGDGGGDFDSDSATGTERDQDEEGSPPPVPYRPRSRSRSGSRSGESSSRSSEDEDEQVTRPARRRKRVIMDDDDSD